jgi:ribosome assembly protein 1
MFFQPENGNVAFSSATDCWSFNLAGFSRKIAAKFGMNAGALSKFLWGDYYYYGKKIYKKP